MATSDDYVKIADDVRILMNKWKPIEGPSDYERNNVRRAIVELILMGRVSYWAMIANSNEENEIARISDGVWNVLVKYGIFDFKGIKVQELIQDAILSIIIEGKVCTWTMESPHEPGFYWVRGVSGCDKDKKKICYFDGHMFEFGDRVISPKSIEWFSTIPIKEPE